MSRNQSHDPNPSDLLDRAVEEVLAAPPDDREVERSAARVWERLTADGAVNAGPRAAAAACDEFRRQIPAYLRAELKPARVLLFEDHSRECLACRRELTAARQGRTAAPVAAGGNLVRFELPPAGGELRSRRHVLWLAAAAVLTVGFGLGMLRLWTWGAASNAPRMARVEAVEGSLFRIDGPASVPVANGDAVVRGEQIRTAKGSRAVIRMTDGSRIEMAERAGFALSSGRDGNTIELERGRIIVQAAHQRPHHLYVATPDCLVSVTGTIFAVNHGIKGTRVSVVEGEVHVDMARPAVLHSGDQVTTRAALTSVPVAQEVAWSGDAARYTAMLAALTTAGKDLDAQVARPGLRTSSTLLDLVPAGSLVYVALPNLAANLQQTMQGLEQRIAESPELQQWWDATLGSPRNAANFQQLITEISDVGRYLGDEVVVAAGAGSNGSGIGQPVLLAQATQEAPLRATLAQEVAAINQSAGKTALVLLDALPSPTAPPTSAAGGAGPVLVWVGQGLLVASPSAAQILAVAGNAQPAAANAFTGSNFHARLAQAYGDGATWLFGADLQTLMAKAHTGVAAGNGLSAATGLFDLQDLVVERHDSAAGPRTAAASGFASDAAATETRAALTFSQTRRGIASWLAAPAPLGSLGFFSADANLVAAFAVKSPVDLLDELLQVSPQLAGELAKVEAEHGFNLRDDLAAPLGGEIALGVDGPLLPTPSWKLVVEVYDPVRLQQTIARAVQQANAEMVAAGKPGVALTSEADGGQTYYEIAGGESQVQIYYVYSGGYLVAAPTRALLVQALSQRASGTSLASSARLRGLLGSDGQVNVSALFYQNLGSVLSPLGAAASALAPSAAAPGRHASGIGGMLLGASRGPSLAYAYAEPDRIVFGGHSEAGPMGLNLGTLAGFGAILGHMDRAHGGAPYAPSGD
jgi:hypothetical protein